MMRVGLGEDIHLLVEGRPLVLAGVEVPYELGALGHSDADVVLHAVADAILGALGKGDIGRLFPPEDPSIKGISSHLIVERCLEIMEEEGYRIGNVDVNVVTEAPKLKPHMPRLLASLAAILRVKEGQVSIKAKTNEGCDAVGQRKAIRANAVVLLCKGENE